MATSTPEPDEVLKGRSLDEPGRSAAGSELVRAAAGPRLWALLLDSTMLGLAAVLATLGTWMVSLPFWEVSDNPYRGRSLRALDEAVPGWVSWVALGVLACAAVVLSGALSRPDKRRSLGLRLAELTLSRTTVAAADLPVGGAEADGDAPAAWRVAGRWVMPLAVVVVLTPLAGWVAAPVVAVALWVPAVTGSRRSVYDRFAGVVVVDPVRSMRRRQDAARAGRTAS